MVVQWVIWKNKKSSTKFQYGSNLCLSGDIWVEEVTKIRKTMTLKSETLGEDTVLQFLEFLLSIFRFFTSSLICIFLILCWKTNIQWGEIIFSPTKLVIEWYSLSYLVPQKCVLATHQYLEAWNHEIVLHPASEKIVMDRHGKSLGRRHQKNSSISKGLNFLMSILMI